MSVYIPKAKGGAEPLVISSTQDRATQLLYVYWHDRMEIESHPQWRQRWGRRRRGQQSRRVRERDKVRSVGKS